MDILQYLLDALTPLNLVLALVGVALGTLIGALPGLSATMAVAILVPFTFTMSPASGLIALGAIYTGAIYGGAFAAIERFPSSSGFGAPESDSGGTVAGGMLGVGVHLTEKISARVEGSLTGELRQRQDAFGYPYLTPEVLAAFSNAGSFNALVVPGMPETRRTTAAGFMLLGYHVPARRASIELVGGLGLLNTDVETSYDVRIARGSTFPAPASGYKTSNYHAVAIVGADVAVTLTEHAAVVPQVRAYALNGALSLRPGLSLRWTF